MGTRQRSNYKGMRQLKGKRGTHKAYVNNLQGHVKVVAVHDFAARNSVCFFLLGRLSYVMLVGGIVGDAALNSCNVAFSCCCL